MRAMLEVDERHWWYRGRRDVIRAELDPASVYLVHPTKVPALARSGRAACGALDGLPVCVAAGNADPFRRAVLARRQVIRARRCLIRQRNAGTHGDPHDAGPAVRRRAVVSYPSVT